MESLRRLRTKKSGARFFHGRPVYESGERQILGMSARCVEMGLGRKGGKMV